MIGTTTLHMDWQPKQGENEFCHTKLTPEIIKKGRSAIRVRIAAAEEEKERVASLLTEEMEGAVHLSVPLTAEAHWGKNWLEAK